MAKQTVTEERDELREQNQKLADKVAELSSRVLELETAPPPQTPPVDTEWDEYNYYFLYSVYHYALPPGPTRVNAGKLLKLWAKRIGEERATVIDRDIPAGRFTPPLPTR